MLLVSPELSLEELALLIDCLEYCSEDRLDVMVLLVKLKAAAKDVEEKTHGCVGPSEPGTSP
jgi:hypothetical protein